MLLTRSWGVKFTQRAVKPMKMPFFINNYLKYASSNFCTVNRVGYTDQLEQFMKGIENIENMSLNDKIVKLRNLSNNLQDFKYKNYEVELIQDDERLIR